MFNDIIHIFFPDKYVLSNGKTVKEKFNKKPYVVLFFLILVAFCCIICEVNFNLFVKKGNQFFVLLNRMFPPQWNYWPMMKKAMVDTVVMSVLGSVIGCLIALPISFYISSNFKIPKFITVSGRGIITILRTVPTLIFAIIFRMYFGMGTLSGTLAISFFSLSICTKMMYEYIETVDLGPYEAIMSTGSSRAKCIWTSVWPQVKGYYLSTVLLCLESNVKGASILGYVGAGGIGLILDSQLSLRRYQNLGLVVLVMTATVVALEALARLGRRKLSQI